MSRHFHHRRPSRLFWFIAGAGTAAFFIKHRESKSHYYDSCYKHPRPTPIQAEQNPPTPTPLSPPPQPQQTRPLGWRDHPPAPMAPWGFQSREEWDKYWEHEKERVWNLGKQAGDTMTEVSEATLDSVLSTVEALKLKLSEHRAEREKQKQTFEKELEEEKNRRPHLV